LFYTDGLVDAMDFNSDLWGRERMLEAAEQFVDCPADHLVRNILAYRRRFTGLVRQVDDTSIIAVKVGPPRRSAGCGECEALEDEERAGALGRNE
jgi:serine phosphatase RsbU (regulator of sigma subunit)